MKLSIAILAGLGSVLCAQEADSGTELRATVTAGAAYSSRLTDAPRDGAPVVGGFRAILYPTWKINRHWAVSGAIQTHSRPYFAEEFSSQGYGIKTDILQAHLSYSQFWKKASLVVRAGQLSSAFGSFLLQYDDSRNYLTGMPIAYGYYGQTVSTLSLTGAEVDATAGRLDMRAQYVNSSPANRRSILAHDQYGNWAGGAGYTIRQGFRVGGSFYYGPYLDRKYPYYFPGEAKPRELPASAYGVDVQWGRGRWNVNGEWQRFLMTYRAIPNFTERTGYIESRYVLHPRWYVAARAGYVRASAFPGHEAYEVVAGFRPAADQLLKIGYQRLQGPTIRASQEDALLVQWVVSFRAASIARK